MINKLYLSVCIKSFIMNIVKSINKNRKTYLFLWLLNFLLKCFQFFRLFWALLFHYNLWTPWNWFIREWLYWLWGLLWLNYHTLLSFPIYNEIIIIINNQNLSLKSYQLIFVNKLIFLLPIYVKLILQNFIKLFKCSSILHFYLMNISFIFNSNQLIRLRVNDCIIIPTTNIFKCIFWMHLSSHILNFNPIYIIHFQMFTDLITWWYCNHFFLLFRYIYEPNSILQNYLTLTYFLII